MMFEKVKLAPESFLVCSQCNKSYDAADVQSYCLACQKPLLVKYDLTGGISKDRLATKTSNMWRYAALLPVRDSSHIVSLGEGLTPVLPFRNLSRKYGYEHLWLKDEGHNPTGSFKARGLSMAISKALELGVSDCIVPTAGNAGGAMSAYCAAAGINATVVMPKKTPQIFKDECGLFGAELILVDGLIDQCGREVAKIKATRNVYDVSTLKEPYRLEGKKTMGYEIAEQMDWQLPDFILYPTGGGTGLIGIWKAFQEMLDLGWIEGNLPRMIVVQSDRCSPIVDAFNQKNMAGKRSYSTSIANGLAVPNAFGKDLIMKVLRESGGIALAVSENEILQGVKEITRHEGIMISPEGAAVWMALRKLTNDKLIGHHQKILLLNTGTGYKYLENLL
ncbi:MAG: threonine synthase [Cytophagales bacterium]|nr:threonine synthase [Cytophagales bacterium]